MDSARIFTGVGLDLDLPELALRQALDNALDILFLHGLGMEDIDVSHTIRRHQAEEGPTYVAQIIIMVDWNALSTMENRFIGTGDLLTPAKEWSGEVFAAESTDSPAEAMEIVRWQICSFLAVCGTAEEDVILSFHESLRGDYFVTTGIVLSPKKGF